MTLAPCVLLLPGFARGHYTPHRLAFKVKRLTVGPKCIVGISLQLHIGKNKLFRDGIRYLDLVLWRWSAWDNRPWKKRS